VWSSFHAADMYISKLVSLGEKVAICEQLTPPNSKDLVERDVVKIVTAGTVTNNELISEKSNNFLGAVYLKNQTASFAWADITTGEFFVKNFNGDNYLGNLMDELVKVSPVEIIANSLAVQEFSDHPLIVHGVLPKFTLFSDSEFNFNNATETLKKQFKVQNFVAFDIEDQRECICVAGALIAYFFETQKHSLINITKIKKENNDSIMMLDMNAVRNLELIKTLRDGKDYGSLFWLLDKTQTGMGARRLQSLILSPSVNKELIDYRLNAVECLFNNTLTRQTITSLLSSIKDIKRLVGKISNGNLMPKDCVALKASLSVLPSIKFALLGLDSKFINDICENIKDFSKIVQLLDKSIVDDDTPTNLKDGGFIKFGFDEELDKLKNFAKNGINLIAKLTADERERTGIKNLKIEYNRVFGYYIEVTNSFKDKVPYNYQRKQTLANAERYITDELKELEVQLLSSAEKALQLETEIYNKIKHHLSLCIDDFQTTADAICELDIINALATVAKENNYTKPTILKKGECLNIVDGRHPVVEAISKQKFIPNDTLLDNQENRTMILTGPNMAGKSTYMRQVAIITLMAQIGSFVPAKYAEIPIVDRIFTRIGASDNLISDQSTFMVEMAEMANIVNNATKDSLLILDEIGRGTSTFDGLSIAWSVVEYITNTIKAKTMFATHYHELTELEGVLEGVKNYKVTVRELQGGIVFMRKIMRGSANKSFGIEVAELAGINDIVTKRARQILKKLEKSDLAKKKIDSSADIELEEVASNNLSQVERIIKDLDVNNLSPMQAFNILLDLQEKVK